VLESPNLAARVIERLNLENFQEFEPHPSFTERLQHDVADLAHEILPESLQDIVPAAWSEDQVLTPRELVDGRIMAYLKHLTAYNDGHSFAIQLSFEAGDPQLAAAIVNAHAAIYLADQQMYKQAAGQQALRWVDGEIAHLRTDLDNKERAVRDFRENNGLVAINGTTSAMSQVAEVGAELARAKADLAQQNAAWQQAQDAAAAGAAPAQTAVLNSSLIQRLREQESSVLQRLAVLTSRYDPNFGGIPPLRAEAEAIRQKIAQETARIVGATANNRHLAMLRVTQLTLALADLQGRLIHQDKASSQLTQMERDLDVTREVFKGLSARRLQIGSQVGAESADARLVSTATEPLAPYFPNKKLFLGLALILSAVSGIGLAKVLDRPGNGIETPEQLESLGMLKLNSIPLVSRAERQKRSIPEFVVEAPRSEFAEAIRSLRGDIALSSLRPRENAQAETRVLALTSAIPREGKSTVAVSLARSMAAAGLHVLLVDCDLRRPTVGKAFGLGAQSRGLVAVLKGHIPLEKATARIGDTSLDILAAEEAVASPQDLLGGGAIEKLLNDARRTYDYVIVDTPAQAAVSDILLIAPHVDATVLLVRWKTTPVAIVTATLRAFEARGVTLMGVCLNGVDGRWLARNDSALGKVYRSTMSYYASS
jgi:capsular exopolysaccharide synthesis family protein